MFRVTKNARDVKVALYLNDVLIKAIPKKRVAPSEMEKIILKKEELSAGEADLTVCLIED